MSFALLLCLSAPACATPAQAGPQARVEVLEGRAVLAGRGAVARLDEHTPARWIAGPAHLELAAGSRARVSWSGRASLLLEGRTVMEWTPSELAEGALDWDFAELAQAHLELRRGPVDVHLAGSWKGRFQSGACFLGGLPGGNVELVHCAGLPIDLWPPDQDGRPSAPFTVLAGGRVRLLGGTLRPLALGSATDRLREPHQRLGAELLERAPDHPAWRGFSWPWVVGELTAIEAATARQLPLDLPDSALLPAQPDAPAAPARP